MNEQQQPQNGASQPPPPAPPQQPKRSILETILAASDNPASAELTQQAMTFELQRSAFEQDYRLARVFFEAGVFNDLKDKSPEQGIAIAFAKVQIGRGWQMNAGDAMQFIYFDRNGTPQIRGEYLAARMKAAGYFWTVEQLKPAGCRLWPKYKGEAILDDKGIPVFVEFTQEDAQTAGLVGDKDKFSAWKGYAKDMYYWKAIARLKKQYAPEIMLGAGIAELGEESEPWNSGGSREAQQAVLAEKLEHVRRFDAERAGRKADPKPDVLPPPTNSKGDFFA